MFSSPTIFIAGFTAIKDAVRERKREAEWSEREKQESMAQKTKLCKETVCFQTRQYFRNDPYGYSG